MDKTQLEKIKSLSHNINTPLTTILGYISLIKKKSADGDILDWADRIKKESLKISEYSKVINKLISEEIED